MPEEERKSVRPRWVPLWLWQRRWWVALATLFILVWWLVPPLLYRHTGTANDAKLKAITDTRTALFAGLIGVGALLTFWLNSRVYRMTEQGHITDRYSKAIEQLGDDQLTIRLGGIYALERIARDSERDHPTVVEVLSAFVREEGHGTPTTAPDLTIAEVLGALLRGRSGPAEVPQSSPDPIGDNGPNESELPPKPITPLKPTTDVQAAITVLGRLPQRPGVTRGNLSGAHLARAQLTGAELAGAHLDRANLTNAWLTGANLTNAWLDDANLTIAWLDRANLTGAHLDRANLIDARLDEANLSRAHLNFAKLSGAKLTGANLTDAQLDTANLTNAWLEEADLTGAHLDGANLTGAHLGGANLTGIVLIGAHLIDAQLDRANLTGAHLYGAHLTGAHLARTDLSGAELDRANLTNAWLDTANLTGAHLERADLSGAVLIGADLREIVALTQEQLNSAHGDANTRLPNGLQRPAGWALDQNSGPTS